MPRHYPVRLEGWEILEETIEYLCKICRSFIIRSRCIYEENAYDRFSSLLMFLTNEENKY